MDFSPGRGWAVVTGCSPRHPSPSPDMSPASRSGVTGEPGELTRPGEVWAVPAPLEIRGRFHPLPLLEGMEGLFHAECGPSSGTSEHLCVAAWAPQAFLISLVSTKCYGLKSHNSSNHPGGCEVEVKPLPEPTLSSPHRQWLTRLCVAPGKGPGLSVHRFPLQIQPSHAVHCVWGDSNSPGFQPVSTVTENEV